MKYMETGKNEYVFLEQFRKRNALRQQDIADFLGTSRGYISMVEKGDSKLSSKNIDKLLAAMDSNQWDVDDLVPAYSRMKLFLEYAVEKMSDKKGHSISDTELFSELPYVVPFYVEHKMKYGEIGINDALASAIVKNYPEINKQWLTDGIGKMIKDTPGQPTEVELLREEINQLRAEINCYKEQLSALLNELPDKIVEALHK